MARRSKMVVIDDPAREATLDTPAKKAGRDHGKAFLVKEMDAERAEAWAIRALLALARAGVEIDDTSAGMAGLAVAGFQALGKLSFEDAKPLLDEMWTCVEYVHEAGHPGMPPNPYIEEVATRLQLRMEVFKLHTGF